MSIPFRRVVIIGVGLIGGSIAAALKQLDEAPQVYGIGPREDTLKTALAAGALDDYAVSDDPKADGWLMPGASDLVIIATPVSAAREWFERLEARHFDGIITDVASTKTVITRIADEVLSDPTRYLPGHPMAGSEVNGFGGARADLFQGAYWILCPEQDTQDEVFLKLHETFSALGARIISISRDQHDSAVAIISHVPHMVASSLVRLWGNHADERKELLRLAAVLRRSYNLPDALPAIALGEAEVDLATGEVRRLGAVESTLTAKEHALVKRLNESRGSIVTTDELCRSVYGDEFGYANALAILVRRLREKVEDDPSHPRWVVTVRGLGYRLMREEAR